MVLLLGLVVAACFGSGDFLGGLASRRASTLVVLGLAQLCALVGAVIVAVIAGGELTVHGLLLGGLAGLLNVTALGCLFRGLAIGRVGVVAPVAAVIGAVIPVAWGLMTGERPPKAALLGVALAVVAGALISRERDDSDAASAKQSLLLAVGAGLGFGTSLICYASTHDESGFWPTLSARILAVAAVGLAVLVTRTKPRIERVPRLQAASAGVLDITATALLLVAVRDGLTSTIAPVASLAPGFTVVHAWWYLREPASKVQIIGLVLALAGLVLIASGERLGNAIDFLGS